MVMSQNRLLAEPVQLPAPAGLPVSPTASDPRIGLNPYIGSAAPVGNRLLAMSQNEASALSSMGIPASTGMTPQDAEAQTEAALAKLAMVNPQLAQQLIEQREGSGGGGIFGFLKDVAGTVLSPVISAGGKFLELITRTQHIVPQWFNPDDEGSWLEDIGQALSGEDKTNWNEVLQNRGILDEVGWLRATVGLGLDVLTDPITFATLGAGAGVTTATKAAAAAKTVVTMGPGRKSLAALLGIADDEASALLGKAWGRASAAGDNIATVRQYAQGGSEEILGLFGRAAQDEVRRAVGDAFELGAVAYGKVFSRTFKSFLSRNGVVRLSTGTEVAGSQMKPIFEAIVKKGIGVPYGDKAWSAAKAAAGAMSGLRFRYAIPFTQFRYISPMVPGSWRLGLGGVGRFGAGLGGFKVVQKLGDDAAAYYAENGWRGLQRLAEGGDELAKNIVDLSRAGRAPFVRSGYFAASELVGGLTSHLSPGGRMFRQGLGFYFLRNSIKNIETTRRRLTNDLFYTILGSRGAENRSDLFRRFDRYFGKRAAKRSASPADFNLYLRTSRKYLDYFGHVDIPHTPQQVANGDLDRWFWNSRADRKVAFDSHNVTRTQGAAPVGNPDYDRHLAVLNDMRSVLDQVTGDARTVLDDMVHTESFGRTTVERLGSEVGDSSVPIAEARVIPPAAKKYLGERPEFLTQDVQVPMPQGVDVNAARQGGVTPEFSMAHEQYGTSGVLIDLTGGQPGTHVPAQLRIRNVMDVHMEDFEAATAATRDQIISGSANLPQILKALDATFEEGGRELAQHLHPALDNHMLRLEWEMTNRAELATQVLRRRPDAPEAVRYLRNGQPESMVVFDTNKIHVMSESAPMPQAAGGYFRRVLTPSFRAKLGGEARKGEARLFGTPAQVELSFRRETRDMTLEEAERHIRATVNADNVRYEGIEILDTEDVFDWGIMSSHESYIDFLGNSYFAVATGRATQRALELGNLVPNTFGRVAQAARVRFDMPAARLRELVRSEKNLQNAYIKLTARQATEEQRVGKSLLDEHNRIATVLAYMDAGLTAENIPTIQMASAMDGIVRSAARLQEVVTDTARRLGRRTELLNTRAADTRSVEAALRVTEYDDLDSFIRTRRDPLADIPAERIQPLDDEAATEWTRRLDRNRQIGDAEDLGDGIWRIDDTWTPSLIARERLGLKPLPGKAYLAVDEAGQVVSVRSVDDKGKVIAQSTQAAMDARRGYATKALLAHWRAENITDFEGIRRIIGANTLSDDAIKLNMRGARMLLRENGIFDPEYIRDAIARGELHIDSTGNILNKEMGLRQGGRRVYSIDEIQSELDEIQGMQRELDDLRQPTSGPATRDQERAATRFSAAVERAEQATQAALMRGEREAFKRGDIVARVRQHVNNAASEFNRAQAEVAGVWTDMKPAVQFDLPPAGGFTNMRQVQIPGLGGVFAHPYVAEEIEHLFRGRTPGHLMGLWREFVLGPWKRWATYRNPGFHVRNFFGAFFNNRLGGVDIIDDEFSRIVNMARGNKKEWATKEVSDKYWNRYNFGNIDGLSHMKGKLTYGDVSEMLSDMGIGRANTTAVAFTMGGEGLKDVARGAIGSAFGRLDTGLRNLGGLTEDFFRVSAWAAGMRHLDGDIYGARAFTMVRHGDYTDLTATEDFIRDLVPFYKWMRTNVPYQFRMLAENPGFFATVDKAQTFVYDVQGIDRAEAERKQPEWMRRSFNIPVPEGVPGIGGQILMADLPYTDLYNGFRDYISSGLPILRNIVESYGTESSWYTGAPLGEKMVPLSGIWANPVLEPLFRAMPFVQKGADGQLYMPDTIDNVLAAVPIYSRYRNWMLADPDRVENRMGTFASALFGFGLRRDDVVATELAFYYDELLPAINRLKDMGYVMPTAEQVEQAGAMITGYGAQPTADEMFPTGVAGTIGQVT